MVIFDSISARYFNDSPDRIIKTLEKLNEGKRDGDYVTLNELYKKIANPDLPPIFGYDSLSLIVCEGGLPVTFMPSISVDCDVIMMLID